MEHKSEKRTLIMSVLMSAPGPLILLFALMEGQSNTQIADFIRRSAELLALIMTYITYLLTEKKNDLSEKQRYEKRSNLFTGCIMVLCGLIMLFLAFLSENETTGNVTTSLIIAALGMIANSLFVIRYSKLNKEHPNSMIVVQKRLYQAKTMVDTCVVIALFSVYLLPDASVSHYLDIFGSVIVALYLCHGGIRTIKENK